MKRWRGHEDYEQVAKLDAIAVVDPCSYLAPLLAFVGQSVLLCKLEVMLFGQLCLRLALLDLAHLSFKAGFVLSGAGFARSKVRAVLLETVSKDFLTPLQRFHQVFGIVVQFLVLVIPPHVDLKDARRHVERYGGVRAIGVESILNGPSLDAWVKGLR